MELKVMSLDGSSAGSVELSDAIFGLEPRTDILQRCVTWQLAKRRAGTHKVKNRAEINRTGKKMYKQKGTGSARHGPAKVNLFRGGGRSFGPVVRSHEIGLPKKVRAQAVAEMARVLKPGGRAIIIDSLLESDRPAWKGLFDLFPYYFHEPYFTDWITSDPDALFAANGLAPATREIAFLSRVMVFEKAS